MTRTNNKISINRGSLSYFLKLLVKLPQIDKLKIN